MSRPELQRVLDFILNRADEGEFEVVRKAVERRNRDGAFVALGSSSASVMANKMAQSVQTTMGGSLESVQAMSRNFIADIIRKQEPGIGDEDLAKAVEHFLPSRAVPSRTEAGAGAGAEQDDGVGGDANDRTGATKQADGARGLLADSALPSDMLLAMTRDFVSYSEGSMAPSRQKELWDEMPRWQDDYWKALPPEIKTIVKAYLEGAIDASTFTSALLSMLGL